MIIKGQTVEFKPEWQDSGDENIIFVAVEDECMDRVTVEAQLNLPFNPQQIVSTSMIK